MSSVFVIYYIDITIILIPLVVSRLFVVRSGYLFDCSFGRVGFWRLPKLPFWQVEAYVL